MLSNYIIIWCVYCFCKIRFVESNSVLTNFQYELLPEDWQSSSECNSIAGQAVYLMKNHFIDRKQYTETKWNEFRKEIDSSSSLHDGLATFMSNFKDKYSTFISKPNMDTKWQSGRGYTRDHGIHLNRKLRFNKISSFLSHSVTLLRSRTARTASCQRLIESLRRKPFKSLLKALIPVSIVSIATKIGSKWTASIICGTLLGGIPALIDTFYPIEVKSLIDSTSHDLQVGDEVISIDNNPVHFMTPKHLMRLMSNRNVTLNVKRRLPVSSVASPWSVFNRQLIFVKVCESYMPKASIECQLLTNPITRGVDGRVGCIAIKDFTEQTYIEISEGLAAMKQQALNESEKQLQGLIMDLRKNSGGVVPSALDTAALFVPKGATVLKMNLGNSQHTVKSINSQPDLTTPLLLLCDSNTASSSEMLVHALVDNKRCQTMGCMTFGKNVAQSLVPLSDGSGLVFTVAEFFTPLGKSVREGHTPMTLLEANEIDNIETCRLGYDAIDKSWKTV